MKKIRLLILLLLPITSFTQGKIYHLDVTQKENRPISNWLSGSGESPDGKKLGVNSLYWTKNDLPWLPVMGEFHYTRYPQAFWEDELLKMKAAGISIISTYVFWVNHETSPGNYDWEGNNNLRQFLELCQKHGLYVWLRPGPYINAEAKNGGLPDWIYKDGKRTNAPWYLKATNTYYAQVAEQVEGLFFKDGGPIIGLQIDNELAHDTEKVHLGALLKLAQEQGMEAPFYTATNNSKYTYENGDIIPMQGAYPYRGWTEPEPTIDYLYATDEWGAMQNIKGLPYDGTKFPRGMCELGVGCWQSYNNRFTVPSYDSEGHVQNALGRGINLLGYFMFQGGTQKDGFQGNSHPLTYDFQAPLGEYGQIRQSYKKVKLLHHFVNDFGSTLALMQPARVEEALKNPTDTETLRYVGRFNKNKGFLFLTTTQCWVDMKPMENVQIKIELENEMLLFPNEPITIQENISPIFPINLDMNGTVLKYATAQLLAKVEDDNVVPHYIFFKVRGVESEFIFNADEFEKISTDVEQVKKDGRIYVSPRPSSGEAIRLKGKNGKETVIVLLEREQAENSWRFNYRGKERLLLSDANVILDNGQLELFSENPKMDFLVFPALEGKMGEANTQQEGIFSKHIFSVSQVDLDIKIDSNQTNQWSFESPTQMPDNVRDIVAYVDYIGSKAEIKVANTKYSDDFYNGTVWDIGLRRFMQNGAKDISIKAHPWDEKVKGIPEEKTPVDEQEYQGKIRSIQFKPVYSLKIEN